MDIDITVSEYKTITTLLNAFLPGTTVWAFGSRVKFTAKPASDLDLVAFIQPEQESDLADLKEAFTESDLSFKVDILNWETLPDNFKKNIEQKHSLINDLTDKDLNNKNWKKHKLKDITTKIGAGSTPTGGKGAYLDDGDISLIRSQNILDFTFSKKGLVFISEKQAKELKNVTIEKDDILLNITGDSVARVCKVPNNLLPARVNQHVAIIRADTNDINPNFLKYYLLEPSFKNHLLALASAGATRNALTKNMIEGLELTIPIVPIQLVIAGILSSLDEKIELNNQLNQTLDTIAQSIFKNWFVNFNFPGFDGKLIDGLPKGWVLAKLGDVVLNFDNKRIPLSSMERVKRQGKYPYYGASSVFDYIDDYLFDGVFLLVGEDGSVITSDGFPVLQYVFGKFWANNHAHVLKGDKEISTEMIYLFLKEFPISAYVTGAVQPKINQGNLNKIPFNIPTNDVLIEFNTLIKPIFEKIIEISKENKQLIEIRDSLLPKLMSGKIKISA